MNHHIHLCKSFRLSNLQLATDLLLDSDLQLLSSGHSDNTTTATTRLDLGLDLLDDLVKVALGVVGQTQSRRRNSICAGRSSHVGTTATLHLADQVGLCGGGEEDDGEEGANNTVIVNSGPDGHGVTKAEKNERQDSEGQGELRGNPAEDIVVPFVGCRLAAVRSEEEGTDVATEICFY